MKYERIERTLEETIEFCDNLSWSITPSERDLILGKIGVEQYLDEHTQQFVDFLFKKVEEFEEGQCCWFWDDEFIEGSIGKYNKKDGYYYQKGCASGFINCISIKEFRKRLKEYL